MNRRNLALLLVATGAALCVVEVVFRVGLDRSDGVAYTLTARRWQRRHWQPINRFGFRDHEYPAPETAVGRKNLFVVGDSLVAGYGIDNAEDRFANLVGRNLGDGWRVFCVAQRGWSSADELAALRDFPYRPDVMVLSYYVNDIEDAARQHGLVLSTARPASYDWLWPLVESSYALNYVYWGVFRVPVVGRRHWDLMQRSYASAEIWDSHQVELRGLAAYAHAQRARLLAVVFPALLDIETSAPITARVAALLRSLGAEVIDLAPLLASRDRRSLVVNGLDAHPSLALHREVAELILRALETPNL